VALYGTAVLESPCSHLYKAHTIPAAFGKAYLLSVVLASLLGYFFYRQWQPTSALWVWTVGAFWLLLRHPARRRLCTRVVMATDNGLGLSQ
jgi:hypothetical protein